MPRRAAEAPDCRTALSPCKLPLDVWLEVAAGLIPADRAALKAAFKDGRDVVDAMTTSLTLSPLPQLTTRSGAQVQRQAAATYAAKLPQLTTLRLHGFVGDMLGEWLAGPLGSCAALTRITQLQLATDRCSEAVAQRLAALMPALEKACLDSQPLSGLVLAMAQHCPRLQSLELAFGKSIVTSPRSDSSSHSCTRAALQGLPPQLRTLHVRLSSLEGPPRGWDYHVEPETAPLSDLSGLAGLESLQWALPWRFAALNDLPAGLTELTLTEIPSRYGEAAAIAAAGPLWLAGLGQLAHLHLPRVLLDDVDWTNVLARLPGLRVASFWSVSSCLQSSPLPVLPGLQELHLGFFDVSTTEPSEEVLLLQHLRTAAPALRLIRPARLNVQASRQGAQALPAVLSVLLEVAQKHPRMAGLCLSIFTDRSFYEFFRTLGKAPLHHAFSELELQCDEGAYVGAAGRQLGIVLRAALPNVERLMLRLELLDEGYCRQLEVLAWGLPKLVYVGICSQTKVLGDPDAEAALKALACALSEQWQSNSSSRSSGGGSSPCLRVEVLEADGPLAAAPLWPLSQQLARHPGVEVWDSVHVSED